MSSVYTEAPYLGRQTPVKVTPQTNAQSLIIKTTKMEKRQGLLPKDMKIEGKLFEIHCYHNIMILNETHVFSCAVVIFTVSIR